MEKSGEKKRGKSKIGKKQRINCSTIGISNRNFSLVNKWLCNKGLCLNAQKRVYMTFVNPKDILLEELNIVLNNRGILCATPIAAIIKYWRRKIDKKLKWTVQAKTVLRKIRYVLFVTAKLQKTENRKNHKTYS